MNFYYATALMPLHFSNGTMERGARVMIAKHGENFILARGTKGFFVVSEKDARDMVKTIRENGKLIAVPASKAPQITGTEEQFQWKVAAGHTCPDGCCGDECPEVLENCADKAEALRIRDILIRERYNKPTCFVRVSGPAYYEYKWVEPKNR